MVSIREIVDLAIATGFLSNTGIEQIKKRLKLDYQQADIDALMRLHQAVVNGRIQKKSPSDETQSKKNSRGIVKMKLVCQTTFAAVIYGTIVFAVPQSPKQAIFGNEITTMDVSQK